MKTNPGLEKAILEKIDQKTKPPGALGRLEEIALQVSLLQQDTHPKLEKPHIVVFAADHGIAAQGKVNPFPQAVTRQMVLNFIHQGAAINVFCRQHNIALKIVDSGIAKPLEAEPESDLFINARLGPGTVDYTDQRAMSPEQVFLAIQKGKQIVDDIHGLGCNFIGFGEMGIGNSSSAALIMKAFTGLPLSDCVGRGTGANEEQLNQKSACLEAAYNHHATALTGHPDPARVLECFGGFEIAMMAGAYLRAYELRMLIVVDGFIATASLLASHAMEPSILNACLFSHCSGEKGHRKMLAFLKVKPLLDLGLRLGEGTGSALAMPLIQSAVLFLNEMASFESAAVSRNA